MIKLKKITFSFGLIILVMVQLILAGCAGTDENEDGADLNIVRIVDFAFEPAILTVKAGMTVVWINEDSAPHKIKSEMFNSQNMKKADSFSQTFEQPGVYEYACDIYPSMTGKIVVE